MTKNWTADAAYAWCRRQTVHYENFSKGSLLFPPGKRPFLDAVYAFARFSDDLVDEVANGPEAERRFRLWRTAVTGLDQSHHSHPLLCALHDTIQRNQLPLELFTDLLEAFGRDLTTSRYETYEELLGYCRYSANPVGRIVLRLFDQRDDELDRLSDRICTALQLVNFLQDVIPDAKRGRIYLPLAWVRRAGIEQALLDGEYSSDWIAPHEQLAVKAEQLFREGRELIPLVPFALRLELRLFIGGGEAALHKVRQCAYNPSQPHQLSIREKSAVAIRALFASPGVDTGHPA